LLVERVPNKADDTLVRHAALARGTPGAEWVLVCDTDEFLLVDKPSIQAYVHGLEARYGRVDVVQFRWLPVNHLEPWCSTRPFGELAASMWQPALNTKLKSMVRTSRSTAENAHQPRLLDPAARYRVVIDGEPFTLGAHAFKKRGAAVGRTAGTAVPIDAPPSSEAMLLHVFVRSLADHITKLANTKIVMRLAASPLEHVAQLINGSRAMTPDALLRAFLDRVGNKGSQLLQHERVAGPSLLCRHNLTQRDVRARVVRLLALGPRGKAHSSLPYCARAEEEAAFDPEQLSALGLTRATWYYFAAVLAAEYRRYAGATRSDPRGVCGSLTECKTCHAGGQRGWALSAATDCNAEFGVCVRPILGPAGRRGWPPLAPHWTMPARSPTGLSL
jgi:NAD(P)-dependent dehydrogenase (short-subunit alcohol dehydrogenase family)